MPEPQRFTILMTPASQASERFITLQDVTFELERSQLGVLRSTGDLEKWALGTP